MGWTASMGARQEEVEDQSTLSETGIEDHSVPSDTICVRTRIQFYSIILEFFLENFISFSVLVCIIIKFDLVYKPADTPKE